MELPGWPPEPGGTYDASYRTPSSEQAILKTTDGVNGSSVAFVCEFEGKEHSYDLDLKNEDLAWKIEKLLRANIGKSIMQIGFLEIED
jgi:hypothetical protein